MADQNQLRRVWQVTEQVGVCMLTTHFSGAKPNLGENRKVTVDLR
jgi:hypothetical protein